MASAPSELVVGQEISQYLRAGATEAAYYSQYYDQTITVDPQLRVPLKWYLRKAPSVDYSTANTQGISIQLYQSGQAVPPSTSRQPGLYTPALKGGRLSWPGIWSWMVARHGLVNLNQRDILLRAPFEDW